jgi:beta-galactosidase GanA
MKNRTVFISLMITIGIMIAFSVNAQVKETSLPRIIEKDGHHALLVDDKPFLMLGGQVHNSSAWPGMMPYVWTAIENMHANTLEIPLYWEQIEPQQGKFDFSMIDTLLGQAREHHVHLVLLWFATWKNGSNHYMPEWMKRESLKYPNIKGKDGKEVDSPSPHTLAAMEADARAFKEVMSYLKKADQQHTVLMVQVENEPGAWGSVRDYSPEAKKQFEGEVPGELLAEGVLKALKKPVVSKGTWQEVFGTYADEYFQAWSVAHYINYVASAGKAVNPLPLYVNVALRDPISNPSANTYESGGATDNVIPIWKVAAPSIDLLAPDIYLPESEKALKVIELYGRKDNPLFVPEIGSGEEYARYFYQVLAHGGIGFSPFGIDDNGSGEEGSDTEKRLSAIANDYALVSPMMRELAEWAFEGKIKSAVEYEDHAPQSIDMGNWQMKVSFGVSQRNTVKENIQPTGKVLVIQLGENDFLIIGSLCHLTFKPTGKNEGRSWQYLKVEEGNYENGIFKLLRVRNGDETDWGGPSLSGGSTMLHITLVAR